MERPGLTAVVAILTELLLSSLNDLQFLLRSFFLYALFFIRLLEFSSAEHYR